MTVRFAATSALEKIVTAIAGVEQMMEEKLATLE